MTKELLQIKIESLEDKGLVQNKDFRLVYFNDKVEIQISNFSKLVPDLDIKK